MEVSIENAGPFGRVYLHGRLTTATASGVYDAIVGLGSEPSGKVVVHAEGLEAATRAGCRAIIVAAKLLSVRRGKLVICGANDAVKRVLSKAGFDYLITFCATENEALLLLHAPRTGCRRMTAGHKADAPRKAA